MRPDPLAKRVSAVAWWHAVSVRQLQRWLAEGGTEPAGDDAGRIRAVGRIVNQLRHTSQDQGYLLGSIVNTRCWVSRQSTCSMILLGTRRIPCGCGSSCDDRMRFTAFRHAAYDTPWGAFPSSGEGRFHRAGQDTVQCLSLHPLGPVAEMLRQNVGPGGDPDEVVLNLWTAVIDIDAVTTVDFQDCQTYGLTVDELVGDVYAPTQALAAAVRGGGADAMVVPSAALPGTHNLILFGARVLHPYLWEPISAEEVPTGHLTDGARSASEVAGQVRWRGTSHAAAEQWKKTGSYELFDDLVATRW